MSWRQNVNSWTIGPNIRPDKKNSSHIHQQKISWKQCFGMHVVLAMLISLNMEQQSTLEHYITTLWTLKWWLRRVQKEMRNVFMQLENVRSYISHATRLNLTILQLRFMLSNLHQFLKMKEIFMESFMHLMRKLRDCKILVAETEY